MKTLLQSSSLRCLIIALSFTLMVAKTWGTPYASGVTRSGDTVSFVLNQEAASVTVLRDGGNPVSLATTPGTHNFDMSGYTSYQIIVTGNTSRGWTQYVPDGTDRNYWYPTSVAINKNPASTNFGKVYIVNNWNGSGTTGAGRTTPDGIYVLRADGVAVGGPYTGGVDWTIDGTFYSSPFKCNLGKDDDLLYVTSFYNDLAYGFNEDLSVATQLIDESNKTASQYVESIWAEGTQAGGDRKIYVVDGNYYSGAPGRKGLIMYDLGANATANPDDTGTQVIGPDFYTFYPRDVARDSSGNWYLNQYRAAAGQAPAISKFDGALSWPINTSLWDTGNTYTYTMGLGLNEAGGTVATASVLGGTGNVWFFDMTTGDFKETFDAGNVIRDLAFDAAGNLVTVDNSLEYARFWSPGGLTVCTTSFDGTQASFTLTVLEIPTEVSVTAADPDASEAGPDIGTFTITRTGDTSAALSVNYTLSGTASNGVDYVTLPGVAVLPASASAVEVVINPIDDSVAELTETVVLTLAPGENYVVAPPASATVVIVDNETPQLQVVSLSTNIYERLAYDYANLALRRLGDTNVFLQLDEANLVLSGSAVLNTDYSLANLPAYIDPGVVNTSIRLIYPIDNAVVDGARTVTVGLQAGTGFTAATNTATTTITDDDRAPETVLFAETFTYTDSITNWTVYYADTNSVAPANDANILLGFDYYSFLGVPAAPNSSGDTFGLLLQVNKLDGIPGAAAVNVYPRNQSFAGDYALRFDMYMIVGTVATTEYSLFGINHSGTKTNWFRNSAGGVPAGWTFDGLFYGVETDAAALGDYVLYSSPTTAGNNPTALTPGRNASTLTQVFKAPPFRYAGAPSNPNFSLEPSWVDVEVSQVGQLVTLKMNNIVIMSYANTTPYTSGNVMLGFVDAYDSIGTDVAAAVIFDNVRVVDLTQPTITITVVKVVGGNVEIDFTGPASAAASAFVLQEASAVNGNYGDVSATVTGSNGNFKAVRAVGGSQQFYRIKRQ